MWKHRGNTQGPWGGTEGPHKGGKGQPSPSWAQSSQEDVAAPPGPRPTPNTTPHRHSPSSSPWGWVSSAGAEASSEFRTEKICKETTIMRVSEVSVHAGWTLRIAHTPTTRQTTAQHSVNHTEAQSSTQTSRGRVWCDVKHRSQPDGWGRVRRNGGAGGLRGWHPCCAPVFQSGRQGWRPRPWTVPRGSLDPSGLLCRHVRGWWGTRWERQRTEGRVWIRKLYTISLKTLFQGHGLYWISWKTLVGLPGKQASRSPPGKGAPARDAVTRHTAGGSREPA